MIIVIPMAGKSQRFLDAGYDPQKPKFMLPLNGATVLDHVIDGLRNYTDSATFLFITRDEEGESFAINRARALGVKNIRTHIVPDPQNMDDTIYRTFMARPEISRFQPVLIHVVDTFRPGFIVPSALSAGGMMEFCIDDYKKDQLSFISVAEPTPRSYRVFEPGLSLLKMRSTGVYYFRTLHHLMQGYDRAKHMRQTSKFLRLLGKAGVKDDTLEALALVAAMRKLGQNIKPYIINRQDVIFCGVPHEYEGLVKVWPMRPQIYGSNVPKLRNDRR